MCLVILVDECVDSENVCVKTQKMHKIYATNIEVSQNNDNHMHTQKNQKRHDEAKPSLTNFRFITAIEALWRCVNMENDISDLVNQSLFRWGKYNEM